MTFSPAAGEQGRKAAEMLRKVLGGESPGNIPIQDPKEIELVVNLKEAREMGVEVPAEVIEAATRGIE